MIRFAKEYITKHGFSIIPLLGNKKPLVKWEEYQKRHATEEEIEKWWAKYPDCMIGIVTGKISNLAVIDVDTKEVPEALRKVLITLTEEGKIAPPNVSTPRGEHFYFRYQDGITNTVNIGGEKIDIRGEGGYVVAPPSITEDGGKYKWDVSLRGGLPEFPMKILSGLKTESEDMKIMGLEPVASSSGKDIFIEGRRDNDLFHVAHLLVKGGATDPSYMTEVITRLSSTCDPPFPQEEAKIKVESAIKRAIRKERPLALEVEEWVMSSTGIFLSSEIHNCLQLSSGEAGRKERQNVSQILRRLVERNIIEKAGKRNACFRKVELDCEEIDWQNAPTDDLPLKFPLDIHELVRIYPSNIIIIAGESNAGKTAFMLDFIRLNMDKYKIHYFNSEMGASELRIRLSLFKQVADWTFTAWERSDNFTDVIRPNEINVIDFLDVTDEFWKVGTVIKEIHEKLNDGIAVIGLQKNEGHWDKKQEKWIDRDLGRGGALSIEKPRLYLSMGRGRMKITKAKNWRGKDNPNGMVMEFKLYQGSDFSQASYWRKPE